MVILFAFLGCPGGGGTEKPPDTGAPGSRDSAETGDTDTGPDPNELDADGDGFTPNTGDCDDTRAHVYPGAPDYCDGLDADCDGEPIPEGSCGEAGDPAAMWSWSIEGTEEVREDGLARLGDVTGDAIDDLGVRILTYREPIDIYNQVISGSTITAGGARPAWEAVGWQADWPTWQMQPLHPAGDTNGDGLSDMIVTTGTENGQYVGAVFLLLGQEGGFTANAGRVDVAADAVWVPMGEDVVQGVFTYQGFGKLGEDDLYDVCLLTYDSANRLQASLLPGSSDPSGTHGLDALATVRLDIDDLTIAYGGGLVGDLDGDGLSDGAWRSGAYNTPFQIAYLGGSDWADGAHLTDVAAIAWDGSPTDGYGLYLAEGTNPAAAADLDQDGLDDGLLQVHRADERYCVLITSGGLPDGDVNDWVTVTMCSEAPESMVTPYEWIDDIDGDGSNDIDLGGWGVNAVPSSELGTGGAYDIEDLRRFRVSAAGLQYLQFTSDVNGDGLSEWILEDGYWPSGDEEFRRTLIVSGFTIPWDDDSKW